jgi:hypothetical protein
MRIFWLSSHGTNFDQNTVIVLSNLDLFGFVVMHMLENLKIFKKVGRMNEHC